MTVLREIPGLVPSEDQVLTRLQEAAAADRYWDTLGRLRSVGDGEVVLYNIMIKAKGAGLEPVLNQLREQHNATQNPVAETA